MKLWHENMGKKPQCKVAGGGNRADLLFFACGVHSSVGILCCSLPDIEIGVANQHIEGHVYALIFAADQGAANLFAVDASFVSYYPLDREIAQS